MNKTQTKRKHLVFLLQMLLFLAPVLIFGSAQFESFIHLQTKLGSLQDFVVCDNVMVLVFHSQKDYIIQAIKEPEGTLLWQKPFSEVYTDIKPLQIVGNWLCFYGKEKPSDFERTHLLNLYTGEDPYSKHSQDFLRRMEPVIGQFGNRLVLKRSADFYVLDLDTKNWFKDDLIRGKSFIALVGERIVLVDKKNKKVLLFSLKDGSIGWSDRKFTQQELDFLCNEPIYQDNIVVKTFPVLLCSKKGLKTTPTLFLLLTEEGSCRIFESEDLMLTKEKWKIIFQDTVEYGKNKVLVVALRPDTPSIADRMVILSFDSNGNLLTQKSFEYVDLHYIGIQSDQLVVVYGDYQSDFHVVNLDIVSLNLSFEKDYGSSLIASESNVQKDKDLYMSTFCKMDEVSDSVGTIVGIDKNNGQIIAFYPFSDQIGGFRKIGVNSSDLFVSFESEGEKVTIFRIPLENKGWWDATLKISEPIYPNSTVTVIYSPMLATLCASAGIIQQKNLWTTPSEPGTYTLTLTMGQLKKDFAVKVLDYDLELNLPEFVYTNSNVEISYTPTTAQLTASAGTLEKNVWKTPFEPGSYTLTLKTERAVREFVANVLPKDTDTDGINDWVEYVQGTDIENSNTDWDTLSDAEDLSPSIDPSEPVFRELQEPGMVRVEQPVIFYGLYGWVDVYTLDIPSMDLVYLRRSETDGVRHSKMDEDSYAENLNRLFESENFVVYDLKKSSIFHPSWSSKPDYRSEFQYFYLADLLHQNEYRFYYDFLQDFRIALMKNSKEIRYPTPNQFYRYILCPIRLVPGCKAKLSVQFTDWSMYNELNYLDDFHYKIPGFLYSFYASNNFDDDTNLPYYQSLAVALIEKPGVFRFVIDIPSNKAIHILSYMKITPIWVERNGKSISYTPMFPKWNVTGITRETIYLQDNLGNSKVMREEMDSFQALAGGVMSLADFNATKDVKSTSEWFGILQKNQGSEDNTITVMEVLQKTGTIVTRSIEFGKKVCSLTEATVKSVYKIDDLDKLPNGHWARSDTFSSIKSGLEVVTGAVSVVTNGYQAWVAFKEGDYIAVGYYALKAVSTAVGAAPELVNLAKTNFGYAGKATKLGVIATKKGQVALAIATGAIEIGYDIYKFSSTDDPIMKAAYGERIAADTIDTTISVFSELYPPLKAAQLVWTIEIEIYSWIFGENLAYKVAKSPGSALVFIWKYFVTDIPSQFAEEAYEEAKSSLMRLIQSYNEAKTGYIAIFVEP